tara:strand:+ start:366 stop:1199 length:834 start_codon:yes stop_codon:yes gene_type:complete
VPAPRPRRISDIMPKIQNVSLSSNFLVKFVLPRGECRSFLRRKGINDRFISDNVGLLCSDAVLPGSAMASLNTAGDFQGMVEKFAHTRNFTQVNFDFMVDNQYKSLKFLEHWMEFISGRSNGDPSSDTYFFKMAYPTEYKSNDTRIVKFERNHSQFLEYRFIGLFPLSLNSTRVSYQNSQVLKATATFSFDRYVCGESSSLARALGLDLNNAGGRSGNARNINYNDAKALDDIINPNYGGLSLLNEGSQFGVVNGRTITGSDSTIRNNGGQTAYRVI